MQTMGGSINYAIDELASLSATLTTLGNQAVRVTSSASISAGTAPGGAPSVTFGTGPQTMLFLNFQNTGNFVLVVTPTQTYSPALGAANTMGFVFLPPSSTISIANLFGGNYTPFLYNYVVTQVNGL